jgi:biopolymer transport protein ExbB/TolQ
MLVCGVGLLSTAAGLIAAGVVLVGLSVLLALRHG